MKRRIILLLAPICLQGYGPLTHVQAGPTTAPLLSRPLGAPIQLFNGHDLVGWEWTQRTPPAKGEVPTTMDGVWSVHDGLLHDKGNPFGYIRTQTDYANYVLTVEQRHLARGNSGIFIGISGPDKVWPRCIEAQTLNGEEGDFRGITQFKMTMDPLRAEPRRLRMIGPSSEKPVGEWETFVIVVDHGNLTLTLNGQLQNLATNTESLAGHIGLQAEGGDMEFRKVELTPILEAGAEK